jgi:NitT/TauT family transport system permease protein
MTPQDADLPNAHPVRSQRNRMRLLSGESLSLSLSFAVPLLTAAVFVVIWQLFVQYSGISRFILPSPQEILVAGYRIRMDLLAAAARTCAAAITGLACSTVLGTLIAFVFSQSGLLRRAFYPYAVLLQTVPIIAIAPIVIVSLGRGFLSISLIACVISLFPVITNTTTGLLQVDRNLLDLFRLNRAAWWQVLLRLRLPSALPYLLTGIRIAGGSAIVGAIVGEFFVGSGQPGLGALIQRKTASLALPELYAVVACSTFLGTAVFGLITLLGEQLLRRRFGMSLSGVSR